MEGADKRGVDVPDEEFAVEDRERDADGLDRGFCELSRRRERDISRLQLPVHRHQLFVGGLELLLRRFQFLAQALEFLVGGQRVFRDLLVLFVGRLVFVERRDEPCPGLLEFATQLLDPRIAFVESHRRAGELRVRVWARVRICHLEQDEEGAPLAAAKRRHVYVQFAGTACRRVGDAFPPRTADPWRPLPGSVSRLPGRAQCRAQA